MQISELLAAQRLQGVSREIEDIRSIPTDLLGLQRTMSVPAEDGDVMMRISGRSFAADIIADDAKAVVKSRPPVRLTQTHIPNVKGGRAFSQSELNLLGRIEQNNAGLDDVLTMKGYIADAIDDAIRGVRIRCNQIIVGMWCDSLTYDANGVKLTGLSWGTPSDLKVTPGTLWTNTAATPVTDVNSVVELALVKYGRRYNRLTLSTTALRNASLTTQFQALAQLMLPNNMASAGTAAYLASANISTVRQVAANVWGLDVVETYDDTFDTEGNDGTVTTTRFLPVNKAVLSSTSDDNNRRVMDWANAIVTESIVASMVGKSSGVIGAIPPNSRGPVSYAEGTFNPPRIDLWAVSRGFARKHVETATACLTVA
jgi:hypothetical protein